ncbi:LysR family transcriptional regulator [Telmatospirillum siberiense]|uniref:LysR family transcriptional regulator n=1 Tax=Telmatospirillum siberiense TaxID=382514 RepID=A0A2N3PZ60_9PROT|nr:LysR family transcriptional regulator [Telmatospirillum siberiense]PKU25693.1 LysR family transcriptional regulator [Telmatospirillum siberiense]
MQSTALRYFLEVVRTGSITEASRRLNVAGSAISRQISRLEEDLGVPLFERRPRGMILSQAGELLAHHARRTLLDLEHVVTEIRRLRGLTTGIVRLGGTEGFAAGLLPDAIYDFRNRYPGIRFDLKILPSAEVTKLVRDGDLDIGLTFVLSPEPGIKVEATRRAPLIALMPPGHPFASREALTLADLVAQPLALPERNSTARQLFDIACGLEGLSVEPVLTTNHMASLWRFVSSGGGLTIAGYVTPYSHIRQGLMVARPIIGEALDQRRYEVQTMAGRRLPEAVAAFLDHLLAYLQECEEKVVSFLAGADTAPPSSLGLDTEK